MTGNTDKLVMAIEQLTAALSGSGYSAAQAAMRPPSFGHAKALYAHNPQFAPFNSMFMNVAAGAGMSSAARGMLGYNPVLRTPHPAGFDSFATHYATRSTGPAIDLSNHLRATNVAGVAGTISGNIFQSLGMSSGRAGNWRSTLMNTVAGRASAELLMSTGVMRGIVGGDINEAMRTVSGAGPFTFMDPSQRHLRWTRDNGSIDYNLGVDRVSAYSRHANTLIERMLDPTTGLSDLEYTRGFDIADISRLAVHMGNTNFRAYDGTSFREVAAIAAGEITDETDADERARILAAREDMTDMVGSRVRTYDALRDLSGQEDMAQLHMLGNALTGGKFDKIDDVALQRAFQKMQALALVMGKDGAAFIDAAAAMQTQIVGGIGTALGDPGLMTDRRGNPIGGYGTVEYMGTVAARADALSKVSGISLEDATANLAEITTGWATSTQGRESALIEYLRQEGDIDQDDYAAYERAMASGDMASREAAAGRILERSGRFDGADGARRALQDPRFYAAVLGALGEEGLTRSEERGLNASMNESNTRLQTRMRTTLDTNLLTGLTRGAGTYEEEVAAAKQTDAAVLRAMVEAAGGETTEVGRLLAGAKDVDTATRLLKHSAFDDVRKTITDAGAEARSSSRLERLTDGTRAEREALRAGNELLRDIKGDETARGFEERIRTAKTPEELAAVRADMIATSGAEVTMTGAIEEGRKTAEARISNAISQEKDLQVLSTMARMAEDGEEVNAESYARYTGMTLEEAEQDVVTYKRATELARAKNQIASGLGKEAIETLTVTPTMLAEAREAEAEADRLADHLPHLQEVAALNRRSMLGRLVEQARVGGSLLDAMGIEDPTLPEEELEGLDADQLEAYEKRVSGYERAKEKYGNITIRQFAGMSAEALKTLVVGDAKGEEKEHLERTAEQLEGLRQEYVSSTAAADRISNVFKADMTVSEALQATGGGDELGEEDLKALGGMWRPWGSRVGRGRKADLQTLMDTDPEKLSDAGRELRERAIRALSPDGEGADQVSGARGRTGGGEQRISGDFQIKVGKDVIARLQAGDNATLSEVGG